jgi:protein TonB
VRAFSLSNAAHLPVTGDLHPLKREFTRWLTTANAVALFTAIAIFGAWYVWSHAKGREEAPPTATIVKYTELGVPPSIKEPTAPQVSVAEAITPPSIGVPEPVPDAEATESTIATQAEMSEALAPFTAQDLGGSGDSIVVDTGHSPALGEFVAFDELPVLLGIQKPIYPELVRQAGIDGTVLVQVLVGKDGKVKQAIAVEGPAPLRAEAVRAARTALFKPALQGTSPVEVWVQVPIVFSLSQ